MPSRLGKKIKAQRQRKGIGLRELARRIEKSPSFLSVLENSDDPPSVAEPTLTAIEDQLDLKRYELVTLAGKTPEEVAPKDRLEVELYRQVKQRTRNEQEELLRRLRRRDESS